MTAMGNRFGIHGLEAASVHSERDDEEARISEVSRPTEVKETRSAFGSSCPDPEAIQTKFTPRYNGAQNEGQETRSVFCRPENTRKSEFAPCYTMNNLLCAQKLTGR